MHARTQWHTVLQGLRTLAVYMYKRMVLPQESACMVGSSHVVHGRWPADGHRPVMVPFQLT